MPYTKIKVPIPESIRLAVTELFLAGGDNNTTTIAKKLRIDRHIAENIIDLIMFDGTLSSSQNDVKCCHCLTAIPKNMLFCHDHRFLNHLEAPEMFPWDKYNEIVCSP